MVRTDEAHHPHHQQDERMADLNHLQSLLDNEAKTLHVPGAAVGILLDGTDHILTTGVTSVDAPAPVTGDTLFQIGSTTKTITATAIMHLVERGRLDLDGRVRQYLPGLRLADEHAADKLTIRHLLTHTGGFLGDIDDGESWDTGALAASIDTYHQLPQLFPPGTLASYNNAGFRLLGRIIEVVCDEPYENAISRIVLTPLNMNSSFFFPWEAATRPHAVGHAVREDGPHTAHTWGLFREGMPEGGLLSSVRDQLRYAAFHLGTNGEEPLKATTRELMQEEHVQVGTPWTGIGLPWLLEEHAGVRMVTHGGNIGNLQLSTFVLAPEHGFAVTTLTNSAPGKTLGKLVTDWCLEHLLDAKPQTLRLTLREPTPEYAGSYDAGQWTFEVDEKLTARFVLRPELVTAGVEGMPDMPLALVEGCDDVTIATDPQHTVGRFLRDDTGEIAFLHLGGRAARRIR
ncbi:serine hydrolase domain-containing protein [Streptosporangium sp. NPDC051022]|uniref:serine hydrolase domain-containing protein n=1 Tax=Streptosporangium sp. NPDC051022 TaxID=3155752 RepID=UPI00344363DC